MKDNKSYKMCWYCGPSTALIVQSPTKKVANYGYYTGISRRTGKPTNTFLVHVDDIKARPDLFKILTEDEAKNKFNSAIFESLKDNKQIVVFSTKDTPNESIEDTEETKRKPGRPKNN